MVFNVFNCVLSNVQVLHGVARLLLLHFQRVLLQSLRVLLQFLYVLRVSEPIYPQQGHKSLSLHREDGKSKSKTEARKPSRSPGGIAT